MNKLIMIPLISMFVMGLFMFISFSIEPEATTNNYSEASGITIDGEERTVIIPQAESTGYNVWLIEGIIVIVIAGIAIGIVSGVTALGSGLSEHAQRLLIISVIYIALWSCLTVIISDLMFDDIISTITWLSLTMMFGLGIAQEITGGEE